MSGIAKYDTLDALGLAELVANGGATPSDLLDEALNRAEERNPKLNAIVIDMADRAHAAIEAGLPDGPFKGVPFLVKDIGTCYEVCAPRAAAVCLKTTCPATTAN
jgi:Asp-tRNA(Asn)/Glu-tRNA(Gln) amidotransferase A subunit family amidase